MKKTGERLGGGNVEMLGMGNVGVFVICGLQGTGKSTVAGMITERVGAERLRTDEIRKEMFPKSTYTEEEMQTVYDEMMTRVGSALKEGRRVVLDATFKKKTNRDWVRAMVEETGVGVVVIMVVVKDERVVRRRLEERMGDASEAGYEHYLATKKTFEVGDDIDVEIDNSAGLDELSGVVMGVLADDFRLR